MRALILAAGEGSRLRPLTLDRPKPMLPIGGVPILQHQVDYLRSHGITEIAINLHYKPEVIVDHFGDGSSFGVRITYSREARLLGSAGAAKQLDWYFDDTFIVLYGDVLTNLDIGQLIAFHASHGAEATLALYEVPDPSRCGIVSLDASDRIVDFREKPPPDRTNSNLANAGIYVLEPSILDLVERDHAVDFGEHVFPRMIAAQRRIYGFRTAAYVLDIGSPERYAQAQRDFAAGLR